MTGVYIHFPFCERKCNYCAFSSFDNLTEQDRYIDALINEIESFASSTKSDYIKKIDTIYFGGGTPSLISALNIERVLLALRKNFILDADNEITIECNPNSTTKEKLECYRRIGINRISLGVQSLFDDELEFLGRLHSAQMALDKIALACKVGFDNISVDLIIGAKGQTKERAKIEVEKLIACGVKHFSTYMLQVEEGTPLEKMVKKNADLLPSDDECVEIYGEVVNLLKKHGFIQYEVSNFAKLNHESRHNFKYWTGENYLGFGLGAHSYVDLIRYANASTFEKYYSGQKAMQEKLDKVKLIEEHIMLSLRCNKGLSLTYLRSLGCDLEKNQDFCDFVQKGVLLKDGQIVRLNEDFYGINNYVIVKLLP